jgi:glycosyltransferase involved in cell wall biosynthesis
MTVLIAAPALIALLLTVVNLLTWPRGRPGRAARRISVLIPARNEEDDIEHAVRCALAALPEDGEVVVADDHSSDQTPQILAALCAENPRLRVIQPPTLPQGWVGKPHACHRLSQAAKGDLLVFVDADVRLAPDGLARISSLKREYRADVVTAYPREITGTFAEHHLMPLLALTYTSWLPLALVWASPNPRMLAANGQVLAVSRSAYTAIGGFAAVRHSVVDDMAFCRLAKTTGRRVLFADGQDLARCRMYSSGGALWNGFTKNLYEGLGERPAVLGLVLGLYAWAFIAPWIGAVLGLVGVQALLVPSLVGVAANVAQRALLATSRGHRWSGLLTHPLAVATLMVLAIDSARRTTRGGVNWAGRTYPRRAARGPT